MTPAVPAEEARAPTQPAAIDEQVEQQQKKITSHEEGTARLSAGLLACLLARSLARSLAGAHTMSHALLAVGRH